MSQANTRPKPYLLPDYCKGCGRCVQVCVKGCIAFAKEINPLTGMIPVVIDLAKCSGCGLCLEACPEPYGLQAMEEGQPFELQDPATLFGPRHTTAPTPVELPGRTLPLPSTAPMVIKGTYASALGALFAGCRHVFGYPITPSTEGAELMAKLLPKMGGFYFQAVSEVATIYHMYGCAGAGLPCMTFTSSPGLSLMLEGISFMIGAQLPGVIVDIMRGGPGLGNIGPEQADVKLACRGLGHGNTHAITLMPSTPQEMLDLTMLAFELTYKYRNPVMVMADGYLGQMTGKVELPATMTQPGLPAWSVWGDREHRGNLHTSVFLDEPTLEALNIELNAKYEAMKAEARAESFMAEDAEVLLVACNTPARASKGATQKLRDQGYRVGLFRPITIWPFPIEQLKALLPDVKHLVVVEASAGQIEDEMRLAMSHAGITAPPPISSINHYGGILPQESEVVAHVHTLMGEGLIMSNAFYGTFERHSSGQGLKGHTTHYCAGCGHGLAHKYLAEALDELGLQDRTITVNPVGCAAFLYFYLDTAHTSTAHGRAAATALGHKVANPNAIVVSYQGDGDLAAIGLAETIATAQTGIPITVIFINNAVYGMTGGQMAPTTLMGQTTTTSPEGRQRTAGSPIRMAELIAQLDGPVYVERVALFSPAERKKAKRAIKKALQMQQERRGYAFVEVLAECPTHLKVSPEKAMEWVKEQMLPVFPLGVKKDANFEPWFELPTPSFDAATVLKAIGTSSEKPQGFCTSFPTHLNPKDISLKLAGSGGDGAQTAAMLIAKAAINEGFDGTHIPAYGPESRGGTSYADVHVAAEEVHNPASPHPDVFLAFNAPSLAKFGGTVRPGGIIIYDNSVAKEVKALDPSIRVVGVPFTDIALKLGKLVVKNIVALGALQAATGIFPEETFLATIRDTLKDKAALIPLNEKAFALGAEAARAAHQA